MYIVVFFNYSSKFTYTGFYMAFVYILDIKENHVLSKGSYKYAYILSSINIQIGVSKQNSNNKKTSISNLKAVLSKKIYSIHNCSECSGTTGIKWI